jgi:P27 family predicted phage terminase small subunit
MKLLTNADVTTLAVYCDAVSRYAEASKLVATDGVTVTRRDARGNGYEVQNPAALIASKYAQIIKQTSVELGLTPAARAKLALPKREEKSDPFKERFGI